MNRHFTQAIIKNKFKSNTIDINLPHSKGKILHNIPLHALECLSKLNLTKEEIFKTINIPKPKASFTNLQLFNTTSTLSTLYSTPSKTRRSFSKQNLPSSNHYSNKEFN